MALPTASRPSVSAAKESALPSSSPSPRASSAAPTSPTPAPSVGPTAFPSRAPLTNATAPLTATTALGVLQTVLHRQPYAIILPAVFLPIFLCIFCYCRCRYKRKLTAYERWVRFEDAAKEGKRYRASTVAPPEHYSHDATPGRAKRLIELADRSRAQSNAEKASRAKGRASGREGEGESQAGAFDAIPSFVRARSPYSEGRERTSTMSSTNSTTAGGVEGRGRGTATGTSPASMARRPTTIAPSYNPLLFATQSRLASTSTSPANGTGTNSGVSVSSQDRALSPSFSGASVNAIDLTSHSHPHHARRL